MISKKEYEEAVRQALYYFEKAGIVLTEKEKNIIEVADFGLSDLENVGLQILTYVNTDRVCAKEMALLPFQTCPQHKHVGDGVRPGKEETFRCRRGRVFLYVPGEGKRENVKGKIPPTDVDCFHEIILNEGEQYTICPDTWHWFQAGGGGAVISEFSTKSTDETDVFSDRRITRQPEVK